MAMLIDLYNVLLGWKLNHHILDWNLLSEDWEINHNMPRQVACNCIRYGQEPAVQFVIDDVVLVLYHLFVWLAISVLCVYAPFCRWA